MPIALIPTLQIASRVISRFGPRRVFYNLLPMHELAACLPFLAAGQGTLFAALAVFGAMGAFMQVCLNVYAGRLEKQLDRLVMSRCHGFWALGLAIESGMAGLMAGDNPLWAILGIAIVSTTPGMWAGYTLPQLSGAATTKDGKLAKRRVKDIP